jgi:hypothetical protein
MFGVIFVLPDSEGGVCIPRYHTDILDKWKQILIELLIITFFSDIPKDYSQNRSVESTFWDILI